MVLKSFPYHFPVSSWRACADGGRQVDTAVFTMAYGWPLARVKGWLRLRSQLGRQCLAEFLGVFVLMLLTQGAVAQAVTSGESKGNFFTMFLAGSLAVTVAIYVSGNVSGEKGGVWASETWTVHGSVGLW